MTPSVFPQKYSLFRRQKRYLIEFQRFDQKISALWDPTKPFPLGMPARFYLRKDKSQISLVDTRTSQGVKDIATVRFNAPISLKIHTTDADPWIITLRATAPVEPAAFHNPETLDAPIVAPPYYLYFGYRRRLLNHRLVTDKFRIQVGKTQVFRYEYRDGNHLIIPQQDDVSWRTFGGTCQELIKDIPFSLNDTPFLEGWVEWAQHWWRMVPLSHPEGTELFVVRNQDPGFLSRNTGIASALVAWLIWLFVPMTVTQLPPPVETASLTVQSTPRFNLPLPKAELARRQRERDFEVRVKVTESPLPYTEDEEAQIIGSSNPDESATGAKVSRQPSRRGRRSFYMGEDIAISGDGILAASTVQKYFERHADEFQTCHYDLLKKQNGEKGAVAYHFTITQFGKADKLKVVSSDIKEPLFLECLTSIINRMDFPRPQSNSVDVDYQFYFEGR